MIAKIGKVLFAQERISKFKKLSNLSFIAGIILLILYPFLSDNIFIVEKQLKFSEGFNIFQDKEKFFKDSIEFSEMTSEWFKSTIENKKLYANFNDKQIRKDLFSEIIVNLLSKIKNPNSVINRKEIGLNNNLNEIINSIQIRSQRGDFSKAIIINFIYDSDKNPSDNSFHLAYAFLKNFENKNFFNWMSKDLIFNFISKDLFYNEPKKLVEFFKIDPFINEIFPEFYINIDLTNIGNALTRSSFYNVFMKINGVNSENIDMDYYKLFFDNFSKIINDNYSSNQFSIKTFENKFDFFSNEGFKSNINYIKNEILSKLNSIFDAKSIRNSIVYRDLHQFYSYLFHNILENYLNFQRDINSNDILISDGRISILLKIVSDSHKKNTNEGDFYLVKSLDRNMVNFGFNVFCVFERALKNLNKVEIDIFRGDHNYILTNNNKFQGTGLFILIPVLCVIRIFYEILQKIYIISDTENEILDSIANNKHIIDKKSSLELEISLKTQFLKDKLANFASFQLFSVLFLLSFMHLSEFYDVVLLNKNNEIYNKIQNLISKISQNDDEHKNTCCFLFFILFAFNNLIKIFVKKLLNRNQFETLSLNNSRFETELAKNVSFARTTIDLEITNITNLLYLGLNLFLIFFLNYPLAFVYILFLMIPEFISINIGNLLTSILNKKSNDNMTKQYSILSILTDKIFCLLPFVPLFLTIYMDSSNSVFNYFMDIIMNSNGNNSFLKFLYLDILIYYSMKVQRLIEL